MATKTTAVMMPANFAEKLAKLIVNMEEDDDVEDIISSFVAKLKPAKATARKTKAKKDPNAPKRGSSGYIFYGKKRRPEIKAEDPTMAFGDITKMIAEEWNALPDKKKKPYLDMAAKDKIRYEKEKKEYESGASDSEEKPKSRKSKAKKPVESEDEESEEKPKARGKAKKSSSKVFGSEGYSFYGNKRRPEIEAEDPDLESEDVTKMIEEEWDALPDKKKNSYIEMAVDAEIEGEDSDEEEKDVDYQKMTVVQLRELAKKRKIDGSKMKKAELVEALEG
jgi:hypothetical protein